VQDLAGVNIADAVYRVLVHQQNFDLNFAPGLAFHEFPEIKAAHQITGGNLLHVINHPDGRKATGVDQIDASAFQRDPPSRMRLATSARPPEQPSRHAQMDGNGSAALQAHHDGLAPAANPENPQPADACDSIEFVIAGFRCQNFPSGDSLLQLTTQRFNFRQFRHSFVLFASKKIRRSLF